jgi:hypothetical protein
MSRSETPSGDGLLPRCPGFRAAPVRLAEAPARPATAFNDDSQYLGEGST